LKKAFGCDDLIIFLLASAPAVRFYTRARIQALQQNSGCPATSDNFQVRYCGPVTEFSLVHKFLQDVPGAITHMLLVVPSVSVHCVGIAPYNLQLRRVRISAYGV